MQRIKWLKSVGMNDVAAVGGKNASLGEMISNLNASGVEVPDGFATTAEAYREFVAAGGLGGRIEDALRGLNTDDVEMLTQHHLTGERYMT